MNLQSNELEVQDRSVRSFVTWLIILLFFPFYGFVIFSYLSDFIGNNLIIRMIAFPLQLLFSVLMRLFFNSVTTYFIVIVSLSLLVYILTRERTLSKASLFKGTFLLLYILALPLLLQYKAALHSAPGNEMKLVTQPLLWEKLTRAAQVISEKQPCEYQLLGWQENWLYYQSKCNEDLRFWKFDSNQSVKPQVVGAVPSNLVSSFVPHDEVLLMVRAEDVWPMNNEEHVRAILLVGDGVTNIDNSWIAIISQHIYGPQDIILIKAASH